MQKFQVHVRHVPYLVFRCGICEREMPYPEAFLLVRVMKSWRTIQLIGMYEEETRPEDLSDCWDCHAKFGLPLYFIDRVAAEAAAQHFEKVAREEGSLRSIPRYQVTRVGDTHKILVANLTIVRGAHFLLPPTLN